MTGRVSHDTAVAIATVFLDRFNLPPEGTEGLDNSSPAMSQLCNQPLD